jgi:hypothetical protein
VKALRAAFAAVLLGTVAVSAAAPAAPPVAVGSVTVRLPSGGAALAHVPVRVRPLPPRVDVMVLLDVSTSMTLTLGPLRRDLAAAVTRLRGEGFDLRVGLALAGTAPRGASEGGQRDPAGADPLLDPGNPAYRPPVLFRRVLPVSDPEAFLDTLAGVRPEVLVSSSDAANVFDRAQAQLLGVDQLLTGAGSPGSAADNNHDAVAPDQVPGWRDGAARLLVSATDQEFDAPYGTRDATVVGTVLREQHVAHVGLMAMGYAPGVADLARLSDAAGTYIPAGGLRCGGLHGDDPVPAGAPFVCSAERAALAVETAVRLLPRETPVTVRAPSTDPVLRALPATVRAGAFTVDVAVACPVAATASRHRLPVTVAYGDATATGTVTAVCAAAAAVPAVVVVPPVPPAPPAPPPAPPAPVPPVPAPPAPVPAPGANAQPANAAQPQAGLRPQDDVEVETADETTDEDELPVSWLLGATALTAAATAGARRTAAQRAAARVR